MHNPVKVGTLGDLLQDTANHHGLSPEQLIDKLGL
jgi:hypothetical protein